MLNVDAHNENVKKKMTFQQFRDSNKGTNGDDQKVCKKERKRPKELKIEKNKTKENSPYQN